MSHLSDDDLEIVFPWPWEDFIQEQLTLGKTKTQKERNQVLVTNSDKASFRNFVHTMYDKINGMFCKYRNPPKGSKCNWCRMCDELNLLLKSDDYISDVKAAYNINDLKDVHMRICASLCFSLLSKVVDIAKNMELDKVKPMYEGISDSRLRLTLDELNTIRYVAGACIHHLSRRFQRTVEIDLLGDIHRAKKAYRCCQLLNCLTDSQANLEQMSKTPETLIETMRRQGNKQGLKFVTDECFDFFKYLFKKVACIQNFVTFESRLHGIFRRNVDILQNDPDMMNKWFNLFSGCDRTCASTTNPCSQEQTIDTVNEMLQYEFDTALLLDMYDELCTYYIKVTLNELRKKYLDKKSLAPKSMQHRHEVLIDKCNKRKVKTVDYPCGKCSKECIDIVTCKNAKFEDFSVQCDKCSKWYHYICVGLTGKESFLKSASQEEYVCFECVTPEEHVHEMIPQDANAQVTCNLSPPAAASVNVQDQNMQEMAENMLKDIDTTRKTKSRVRKQAKSTHERPLVSNTKSTDPIAAIAQSELVTDCSIANNIDKEALTKKCGKRKESKKKDDERPLVTRSGRAVKKKVIHDA